MPPKKEKNKKEVIEEYYFTEIEHRIVGMLYTVRVPMSSYYVAKRLEIGFETAQKYLENLFNSGVVISIVTKTPKGEKISYKFNFEEFEIPEETKRNIQSS